MKKRDDTYFWEKIALRISSLPDLDKVNVLECFAGTGRIWDEVSKHTNKTIKITRIEKTPHKCPKTHLLGDNRKFLPALDLNKFDVIDLDAYGVPFDQLEIIFQRRYHGIVVVTFIQALFGSLPNRLLSNIGYSQEMVQKCRSLFYRDGLSKMEAYLWKNGVKKISGYFLRSSYNYFSFTV